MKNRFEQAVALLKYSGQTILDLGCRNKELVPYLHDDVDYTGIDFEESKNVIARNLEDGIEFDTNSYDTIFALDVLEHLENMHQLLNQMKNVAKNEIVLALPNCYHWHYKLNILTGKALNTKFRVPTQKILDRHRWLTFHKSNVELINEIFKDYKITHSGFICNYNKYKFLHTFDRLLSKLFPNTFVYTDFFHIDLKK